MVAGKRTNEQGGDDRLDIYWFWQASRIHHCPAGRSTRHLIAHVASIEALRNFPPMRPLRGGTFGSDDYRIFSQVELLGNTLVIEERQASSHAWLLHPLRDLPASFA